MFTRVVAVKENHATIYQIDRFNERYEEIFQQNIFYSIYPLNFENNIVHLCFIAKSDLLSDIKILNKIYKIYKN